MILWTAACQASLFFTISRIFFFFFFFKFLSMESVMLCKTLILCHPLRLLVFSFFPGSGSFQMSQLFTSGGQSFGVSASASVLLMDIKIWFPLGLTCLISLLCKGLSRVFCSTTVWKNLFFSAQPVVVVVLMVQLSQPYMTTGNTIALIIQTSVDKEISLHLNVLSRFAISFLPRSNGLLISWLQSESAVILEPKKIKYVTASPFSPSVCHEVIVPDAMVLAF